MSASNGKGRLPQEPEAEAGLAGACLSPFAGQAIPIVASLVRAEHFASPGCRHVFEAAVELHGRGETPDPTTVAHELKRFGLLAPAGGEGRLIELQVAGVAPSSVPSYARMVREAAERRLWILAAEELKAAGRAGDRERAERALAELLDRRESFADPAATAARSLVRMAAGRALVDGGAFVFELPARPAPVWGDPGGIIAWSQGEYLLVNGPSGVGKTTLLQQVMLARLGIRDDVLGLDVEADDRNVLYLALDRPDQIARSLRRMVGEPDRVLLDARLRVWRGPMPGNIVRDRELVGAMAEEAGAGTVVVDSLKDLAPKLSDEETGQAVKEALSVPCLEGIQVAALHHQRKAQAGAGKPKHLDDVFGSKWITAGAGSVLLLWGEPGDAVVELSHLKPPAEPLGPWTLLHDHVIGVTTVEHAVDLAAVVRSSTGLTAEGAARALFRTDTPSRNELEKARRQLERLVSKGLATGVTGGRGPGGQQLPTRYHAVESRAS